MAYLWIGEGLFILHNTVGSPPTLGGAVANFLCPSRCCRQKKHDGMRAMCGLVFINEWNLDVALNIGQTVSPECQ